MRVTKTQTPLLVKVANAATGASESLLQMAEVGGPEGRSQGGAGSALSSQPSRLQSRPLAHLATHTALQTLRLPGPACRRFHSLPSRPNARASNRPACGSEGVHATCSLPARNQQCCSGMHQRASGRCLSDSRALVPCNAYIVAFPPRLRIPGPNLSLLEPPCGNHAGSDG